MMKQEDFDNLVSDFVLLDTKEKADLIISSMKEDIAIFKQISELNNLHFDVVFNREIVDVTKDNPSVDDYYVAIFVYLKMMEDVSGKLLDYFADNT